MAYKFREEIVGKRFLSVSGFSKLKVNKISEWGWRAGVIRAASHRDNLCSELQVLVEYDDVEWQRREWLSPHKDSVFSFFLIEKGLSWADRPDPKQANLLSIDHNSGNNNQNQPRVNGKTLRGSAVPNVVSWPAVTFYPILARAEIPENSWPLEFMQDRHLDFVDYAKTKPFTADWDLAKGSSAWGSAVRRWAEMQDGQSILLTTPSILVGFRVEVYRAEGTTQWYTAVIVGYNEATKDLTVTDDTVLEDHSEDPRLVQMRLIGDGVVESIMRGEVVGMTPRRSRSSTGLAHTLGMSRKGRRPRGRPVSVAHLQTTLRSQSIAAQQIEKEKSNVRNRRRRISEGSARDKTDQSEVGLQSTQEDRENKGPLSGKPGIRTSRTVLEEANTSPSRLPKLRRRGVAVKSAIESFPQRLLRRRARPESKIVDEDSEENEEQLVKSDKKGRSECKSEEQVKVKKTDEEDDESCDPLINRLKTSQTNQKIKKEKEEEDKKSTEQSEKVKSKQQSKKAVPNPAEEESESRERDREPEPPPPDKSNTEDSKVEKDVKHTKVKVIDSSAPIKSEVFNGEHAEESKDATKTNLKSTNQSVVSKPKEDEERIVQKSSKSPLCIKEEPEAAKKVEEEDKKSEHDQARTRSDESVELLESKSQDSGSVLERLSPLNAGGRLLLQQQEERSRHNESPVILAERLNKPPPSSVPAHLHHHPQHHHQQHIQHSLQYHQLHHNHRYQTEGLSLHQHHHQPHPPHHHHHLTAANLLEAQQQSLTSSRSGDDASLMDVEVGAIGVGVSGTGVLGSGVPASSGLRAGTYTDSGSDSGGPPNLSPVSVTAAASTQPPVGYQSNPPSQASHHHPAVAPEMLWRPPRYPTRPIAMLGSMQPNPEELVERERHERMLSERRDLEVRELEKREREATMERDRAEKQRAEQAVHKHFEESLRRAAQQKMSYVQQRSMHSSSMPWNSHPYIPMAPPGSRTHTTAPHAGLVSDPGHHHPGPGPAPHPVTIAQQQQHQQQQQQQQQREREERDAANREREHATSGKYNTNDSKKYYAHLIERQMTEGTCGFTRTSVPPAQEVPRPSSVPSKVDYPPPAHSRASKVPMAITSRHDKPPSIVHQPHSVLPKVEPSVSLFGYTSYQPVSSFTHDIKGKTQSLTGKNNSLVSLDRDHHRDVLPNPPPLLPDHKNSVIVKNEGSREHPKAPLPQHSSSPKMMTYMNVQTIPSQHKPPYEYRSPTPIELAHHRESLQNKSIPQSHTPAHSQVHHRPGSASQLTSPHVHPSHSHNRHSPHTSHPVSQPPHPSPPEPRYLSRPEPMPYAPAKTYPQYPHPRNASPPSHYPAPAGSKPKVSSPAPSHIYGQPNSGIMTGTPVCRPSETGTPTSGPLPLTSKAGNTPLQQVPSLHHGAPPPPLPPPAHSSRSVYDSRGFGNSNPGPKLPPPPMTGLTPLTRPPLSQPPLSHPRHLNRCHVGDPAAGHSSAGNTSTEPLGQIIPTASHQNTFQTQPLDLGVEKAGSPKRKAQSPLPATNMFMNAELGLPIYAHGGFKKRKVEEQPQHQPQSQPPQHQQQPMSLQTVGPPVLSRVSEPSPLIASAATTITTVVNTALLTQPNSQSQVQVPSVSPAPRTASGDGSIRPSSTGSVSSQNPTPSTAPSPTPVPSPAPSAAPSPTPSAPGTPAKTSTVNNVDKADSEKSNSPAPRPPSSTSYPVHKLKKAWLQRHSGEDGSEDTVGVVGSGSCVTLPLNIAQAPSQPLNNKEKDSTTTSTTTTVAATTPITTTAAAVTSTATTTSTSHSSAVNSIHNVGSMAVNSINKTKVTGKSGRKPTNKETLNGHATDTKSLQEDSSSSDPERKSPPKRKPPKVKRKKGAARRQQAAMEEMRRRKEEKQSASAVAGSESSNDSEAGSASDAVEQANTTQPASKARHTTANSNNSSGNANNREPRKRGRRPKTAKNSEVGGDDQQPRQKKERRDDSKSGGGNGPSGGNNRKPPVSQLKKTLESWLQDGPCFEVAPRLAKCRECRWTPNQRSKMLLNIFCRFYAFRRLRFTKCGMVATAGFCDPHKDASEEDLKLWQPGCLGNDINDLVKDEKNEKNDKIEKVKNHGEKADMDLEMAHRLLRQIGDQFCDLVSQEKNALQDHMTEANDGIVDGTVAWKRVVQGIREMCDVCETTLFNYHWACARCGFVVCIDCYKGRKNGTIKIWGESRKDMDPYSWLLCTSRQAHEPERLMLTQIIAGDCLLQLGKRLHDTRAEWGIPQHCGCSLATSSPASNDVLRSLVKGDTSSVMNGNVKIKEEKKSGEANGSADGKVNGEDSNSRLSWLADVALQNQEKNDSGSSSDSDEDREGYSTLRELLIRPSHKTNANGSRSNSPTNPSNANTTPASASNTTTKSGKKSKMDELNEVISSVIEHSANKEDEGELDEKPRELKHFVRRYKWTQKGREPLPIRIMTLTESKGLYPDVPHSWLCDGKLLKLTDPNNPNNYRIFQDQWKRGQPVIVSDVTKDLNIDLWHPDSFARDFGDEKNDLINCMTGNLVPNQPMRKFWEGFENFSKRLKDDKGNPMLLKLKDWPPGDDFAELLPSRYNDLMKVLPLSEYTSRTGRLNLASRLPTCFVRPDLGPKMYNAYGSALHSDKGTTNLHLDISDAVNVMVYVGIPKDGDNDEHVKEALKAIDDAGCDILTRRRVRERGESPGALWHIYAARDADKIRDLLNAVAIESGARLEPHHDPIHDQSCYLDGPLRERLYREYGVEGYAIVQCLGDAVFVPAGAPHQVRNLHNCIKVAEDFVSPENVSHCFHLTQEFRALSDTHTNHEDKLQIKNIIYHAVKYSLTVLANVKEEVNGKIKVEEEGKEKEET